MNRSMAGRGDGKHETGRLILEDTALTSEIDSCGRAATFPPGH